MIKSAIITPKAVLIVLYVLAMALVVVGIDFLFLRGRFWDRLVVNFGIILVFAAVYLEFFKNR